MHVLMFQPRFVPMVRAGTKRHTIRPPRKRKIQPGDSISLRYWSELPYRSPQVEILNVLVKSVHSIFIDHDESTIDGVRMTDRNAFARADGFSGWQQMLHYWEEQLPFEGILVRW